ncbi:hypothetical protein VNO80_32602 [Phaseolus coccineus]|uniref:Senescence-associated protein n=1 Tax=Phaseolus coccineus TaxID=3886 RepID=A0AAN9KZB9_PHACN
MIGRADIEGSKSNVAMNAWLPQASYPCGNFSDTSSFKFRRTKGSIGHAFTVRIRTGNQNQTSFYPFVPHEISVLVELILGHLRYLLTDVPPQPNSPPDNVFRPDRPAEADLGSKKRGSAPPPIHGISKITGPKGPVPNPSPDRHATTRSRRGSSSSSPPTADGFGTGTPVPSPQSQSFSRGYGSILPTSLAYIVPSTRGCSPWRPDAVMSTTGRGRHSVLRIFKGRRGRTGHHATCGALPAAGPYLRLSRFQGGQAICTDDRSARAHALGFTATAAPSYSSGLGPCPDGRVSAQLGTVTQLPVHPASPVLLTKNGPLGALDSVARLNRAAVPSYLFKSDERFARQYRCGPPPEFPLASPRSGIVHHLSGPDRYALTRTLHRRSGSVGGATHRGIPPISFLAPYGFTHPLTRTHVRLLGPCFKTGRMGSPQADARSAHVPRHAMRRALPSTIATMTSPRAFQQPGLGPPLQSASVNVPSRSADRLTPFHIRPGHIAGPHPLPSRQFQALFDSLFKVLFIFPSRYLFAIGLSPVFSLGRNLPPDWGCIPKQPDSPTAPRGATGSGHNGALTLSGAPFQGTWARSATEDASPDYNSNAEGDRFSWWAFPGSLAVTRGILRTEGACGVSKSIMSGVPQPRLVSSVGSSTDIAGDSVPNLLFNQPREGRRALSLMALGATCVQRLDGSRDSAIHTKYRISLRSSSMQEPRYPAGVSVLSGDTGLRPDAPSRPPALSTTHTGGRAPAVVRCSVDFSPRRGQRTAHVAAIRTLHRTIQSACFEHSNFFKVTAPEARPGQLRPGAHRRQKGRPDRCTPEADRSTQPKPFLRLPLRNRTLILRHPSPPWINQVASIRVAPAPARVGRLCSSLPHTRPSHIADRESSKVGSTGNVIAHPRKGGNERDACLTVRCTGHGASQQQHPHYNSHTLAFARPHTTRRFQPVSSAFLLPNTAREDGFDGEATGMSRCLPSGAHVCPQSETHTHDESHIFLSECIRDWVLGWCCVCMAQIFPRSHQARVSTRLTRVVFQLPKIIQADHDAKMVEGEPTQ